MKLDDVRKQFGEPESETTTRPHSVAGGDLGGDWECINGENDLHAVWRYVVEAQERKDRDPQR